MTRVCPQTADNSRHLPNETRLEQQLLDACFADTHVWQPALLAQESEAIEHAIARLAQEPADAGAPLNHAA